MPQAFIIKQGDLLPPLEAELTIPTGAFDLSNATDIKIHYRLKGKTSGTVTKTAAVKGLAPSGIITYAWVDGDTDVPGDYDLEVEVTEPGPVTRTFPNDGYKLLRILPQLG